MIEKLCKQLRSIQISINLKVRKIISHLNFTSTFIKIKLMLYSCYLKKNTVKRGFRLYHGRIDN